MQITNYNHFLFGTWKCANLTPTSIVVTPSIKLGTVLPAILRKTVGSLSQLIRDI